jgi:hypothetical protein
MKIVYTVEPIEGIVENAHPPFQTRMAKEKLKAIIEEKLIPMGLVESYTIADDREFPFPFGMPNIMHMNGFFGKKPNYNKINKEVKELFNQPKKEFKEFGKKLKSDLEKATDEEILGMVERFHYTPDGTKKKHAEAVAKVKELWKPYDKISNSLGSIDYNHERQELVNALKILDDCHVYGLLRDIQDAEKLLKAGERDEAVKEVVRHYEDWARKNLAHLYNECGDAQFYGAGFFLARMIAHDKEDDGEQTNSVFPQPKKVEEVLERMDMPYQVIRV